MNQNNSNLQTEKTKMMMAVSDFMTNTSLPPLDRINAASELIIFLREQVSDISNAMIGRLREKAGKVYYPTLQIKEAQDGEPRSEPGDR